MLTISCFTGGIAQTNGYLVQAGTHVFAVDAPEGFADWIAARKAHVTDLFLTHQHFDHVQDAGKIQEDHGARVYAFAPYSKELTLEFLMGFASGTRFEVPPFVVDEVLEGQGQITAAGLTWKLEHIPGHSTDSIVFIAEAERTVFGGDVLFLDGIGRPDFPGGDLQLLLGGIIKKLFPLPPDFTLYPGHGSSTTIGREREFNPYFED